MRRTETTFPRPRGRTAALGPPAAMLFAVALTLVGCGRSVPEIPEGCFTDAAVAPEVRQGVEKAASVFLDLARQGAWQAIWDEAATAARESSTQEQFIGSIQRTGQMIGFPPSVETVSLATVRFGESFPPQDKVVHQIAGDENPLTLLLTDHPVQASLVQKSVSGPESFYFATLWFLEDGRWKLAAFFAKPASAYGRDWESYAEEAAAQRLAGHLRNAAILYNLAIDLVVPAAWIKPPEVERLQKIQKRISVDRLPAGRINPWPDPPDTFKVISVQYNILPSALGLLVGFESPVAVTDTLGQAAYAAKLYRYVEAEFPEYPEVFTTVTLQAYDPATHRPFWVRNYPLEKAP